MDHRIIPNYNQIQIQFLSDYAEGVLEELESIDVDFAVDSVKNGIERFQEQVEHILRLPSGEQILELENLRNEKIEEILDRLDDHLNISVMDIDDALATLDITVEKLISGVSGFSEACRLLGKNKVGDPDFPTHLKRGGHVWGEQRYRVFLNRLESREFEEELEILGIAEKALELKALDHRQLSFIDKENCAEDFKDLRKLRYDLHTELEKVYHAIYSEELFYKNINEIPAIELLIDDINTRNDVEYSTVDSINDLSYDELISQIESVEESTIPAEFSQEWSSMVDTDLALMKRTREYLSKDSAWNEFQESEQILLKAVERLYWELPSNLRCSEERGYESVADKIRNSPRYLMAMNLIQMLQDEGIHIDISYALGDVVDCSDIPKLVELVQSDLIQEKFDILRIRPLLKEIIESEEHSRSLIEPVIRQYNTISLDEFRDVRTRVSALCKCCEKEE